MRSALRGPAHQLACVLIIAPWHNYGPRDHAAMHHARATARAPKVCTLINPRCACAAKGYCSRSYLSLSRSVCGFLCLSVPTFSLEPWLL